MPKNKLGGKKHKRGKKKPEEDDNNRQIVTASSGQVYAIVRKKLGGTRLAVDCSDDKSRSAIICGKFRKRIWMNPGDILLCDLDAVGTDDSCLINHKYRAGDINILRERGLITFDSTDVAIGFETDSDTESGSEEVEQNFIEDSDSELDDL